MKTYQAKIDYWIFGFIAILLISISLFMISQELWGGLSIILLVMILLLSVIFNSKYEILEYDLKLNCGFLYHKTIHISEIRKTVATRNPLSAPAPSLDRIAIYYGKGKMILVSPKDKAEFIAHLQKINPTIVNTEEKMFN